MNRPNAPREDTREKAPPDSDMQPEDTGTERSQPGASQGTDSEAAMKQTSKTEHERGSGG